MDISTYIHIHIYKRIWFLLLWYLCFLLPSSCKYVLSNVSCLKFSLILNYFVEVWANKCLFNVFLFNFMFIGSLICFDFRSGGNVCNSNLETRFLSLLCIHWFIWQSLKTCIKKLNSSKIIHTPFVSQIMLLSILWYLWLDAVLIPLFTTFILIT